MPENTHTDLACAIMDLITERAGESGEVDARTAISALLGVTAFAINAAPTEALRIAWLMSSIKALVQQTNVSQELMAETMMQRIAMALETAGTA